MPYEEPHARTEGGGSEPVDARNMRLNRTVTASHCCSNLVIVSGVVRDMDCRIVEESYMNGSQWVDSVWNWR